MTVRLNVKVLSCRSDSVWQCYIPTIANPAVTVTTNCHIVAAISIRPASCRCC
jgi:hypothetical protein